MTTERKKEHIEICLHEDVTGTTQDTWDKVNLPHCACPDLCLDEIQVNQSFLGNKYSSPFLISSMTGGESNGDNINARLAKLSSEKQIPMGLGSLRIAVENQDSRKSFYKLREQFPEAKLWANFGLVQLNYGLKITEIDELCKNLEVEALILHLNPLQECLQPEGNTDFRGLVDKFAALRQKINIPIVIKETGCGMDIKTSTKFVEAGADAIDVAGLGGTHWGIVESRRNKSFETNPKMFSSWGISSPRNLITHVNTLKTPIIASGGIKNGLDAAKAFYLGAQMAGMAGAFFKSAENSYEILEEFYENQLRVLKIALMCTNSKKLSDLIGIQTNGNT